MSSDDKLAPGESQAAGRALARYGLADARVELLGAGLINRTYRVHAARGEFVLQRVNPIFDPKIHFNIRAVTERLAARGIAAPRLLDSDDQLPFVDLGAEGVWRVMTLVGGKTFDVVDSTEHARSAGRLVARFHAALDGIEHAFVGMRVGVHDTPRHLRVLAEAIVECSGHRLHAEVSALGKSILESAARLPPLPALPPLVGHGDLKFNNILFCPSTRGELEACALVDLDTVGPQALAFELGDAWRSWCNPHGEDREDARFDLDVYEASLDGYLSGIGRSLSDDEKRALLHGVEWISMELAARFAADALRERYFGWDSRKFPAAGEHNLVRAKSQYALHGATLETRTVRANGLGLAVI